VGIQSMALNIRTENFTADGSPPSDDPLFALPLLYFDLVPAPNRYRLSLLRQAVAAQCHPIKIIQRRTNRLIAGYHLVIAALRAGVTNVR